ncbi:MAG: acyl-ACP--UDP-N-acetylglucosamine O-acyltransferase [Candidatus Omnitrophica bacterium]|nr:acyl-ACP--UDP-N-acetylglucosamine O-acyltransferase [Candidatus Omnitrophota bacterium]
MSNSIHPTAVIGLDVKLGHDLLIGPYAVIDGEVTIGDGTEVGAHATVSGWTTIGKGCRIFPHASIGSDPQDKKYKRGDKTCLEIGDNNIFREFVTVNRGTTEGGAITRIGNNNLFMAYAHVAHDCTVGNDCVFANSGTLAGHVVVGDRVVIGGLTAIHQFCRVGTMAMIGGCSRVIQDIPPYSLCVGGPALVYNLNAVGLRRAGMTASQMKHLKEAFRLMFHSGLAKNSAIDQIEKEVEQINEVKHLVAFAKDSQRGLCGSAKEPAAGE